MKAQSLIYVCATTLLLLLVATPIQSQDEVCSTCGNVPETCHQGCRPSDGEGRANGAVCRYGWDSEHGCLHCQWEGECGESQEDDDLATLLLSPAGTVPAQVGTAALRFEADRIVLTCSGFVVTHVDNGREPTSPPHTLII